MASREELLQEINDIIEEEHGDPIGENETLVSSGVDSFGLTMVLVTMDQKYELYTKEEFQKELMFTKITPAHIIDRVLDGNK